MIRTCRHCGEPCLWPDTLCACCRKWATDPHPVCEAVVKPDTEPGTRFGRLTVISEAEPQRNASGALARCFRLRCDCGNETTVRLAKLRDQSTRSCGCLAQESRLSPATKHRTHGQAGTKRTSAYAIWCSMLARCTNPRNHAFRNYGGRGISVCPEWKNFEQFLADMGPRPGPEYTLDRVNNDGPYEPGNCRWATRYEQARNSRVVTPLTYGGVTLCIAEWSERLGVNPKTISTRLGRGWTVGQALGMETYAYQRRREAQGEKKE